MVMAEQDVGAGVGSGVGVGVGAGLFPPEQAWDGNKAKMER